MISNLSSARKMFHCLHIQETYTSLLVVEMLSSKDSMAIHLIGNRPPCKTMY